MKAAIYCRKSSEDRNRQILSLDDQERENRKVVEIEKLNLVMEPLREEKTAKKPGRPVFNKLITMIKSGAVDTLVTWDASRLARNAVDGGAIIHLIDTGLLKKIYTPYTQFDQQNSFMLWIEFGLASDYIKKLSFGVKRAAKGKAERGEWPGGIAVTGYLNTPQLLKGQRKLIADRNWYPARTELYELADSKANETELLAYQLQLLNDHLSGHAFAYAQ